MKQPVILFSLMISCMEFCIAQQPVLDPKKINTSGQKDVRPGQLKMPPPPPAKVSFSAVIAEPRSAVPSYEDGNIIARYTQLQWNEGNGFDAAKGIFTAPAQGLYCFIGNFSITKYGCAYNPISYSVTVMKNNTQPVESFNLPVSSGGIDASTTESIMLMVQLNANDKITLRPAAVACEGGQVPMLRRVVFSGYKVY